MVVFTRTAKTTKTTKIKSSTFIRPPLTAMHFLVQPLSNPVLDHMYISAIAAKIKSGIICDSFICSFLHFPDC
jgi:hypothetical protein